MGMKILIIIMEVWVYVICWMCFIFIVSYGTQRLQTEANNVDRTAYVR